MKENYIGKMKSLLVAILMIASAMFVFVVVENVKADLAPDAFTIRTPQDQHLNQTYGTFNISWTASSGARGYNVSLSQILLGPWPNSNPEDPSAVGTKYYSTTNTYVNWDTTNLTDGIWYINVTAVSDSDTWIASDLAGWTNATDGPAKFEVHNNIRGTPGVDVWRGANYTVHTGSGSPGRGHAMNELRVFSSVTVHTGNGSATSLEAGDKVSLTLDSDYVDNMTSDLGGIGPFYLCYPSYTGGSGNTTMSFRWRVATTDASIDPDGTDNTFENVWLTNDGTETGTPVAGMWIIDDTQGWSNGDVSNASQFNSTVPAWFWVNTSTDYTVTPSATTWAYNASGTITVDVRDSSGGKTTSTFDIRRASNDSSLHDGNQYDASDSTGYLWNKNNSRSKVEHGGRGSQGFWSVGNYTVRAYYDKDVGYGMSAIPKNRLYYTQYQNMGNTGKWIHYNNTFGANSNKNGSDSWLSAASRYNWLYAGPWDPPEHNASMQTIRITTGTPTVSIPTANQTMYFDFPGEVNVSIAEAPSGVYLEECYVSIWDEQGDNVTDQFQHMNNTNVNRCDLPWTGLNTGRGIIDMSNVSKGYIRVNHSSWGKDTDGHAGMGDGSTFFGGNGSWTVKIFADVAPSSGGDRNKNGANRAYTEEWNTSITFQVASSVGRLIFTLLDDDGNITGGTNTDGVIRRVPQDTKILRLGTKTPVEIQFKIENEHHQYMGGYSGGTADAMKNITISGDALFLEDGSLTLNKYPELMRSYSGGTWTIRMIPVMNINGGTITIAIDWGPFGTHTETITIGGTGLNGTIVEVSPTTFTFGENATLTATVKHPATGTALTGGTVTWYWLRSDGGLGDKILTTGTPDTAGGNTYSFNFNTTMQSDWQVNSSTMNGWGTTNPNNIKAPRNITAYVNVTNVGKGYARAKMEAITDLKVTVYPSEVMAGRAIPPRSGGGYQLYFNVSIIDSSGNYSGRPKDIASTSLLVRIYNSTGHDVTDKIGSIASTDLDDSAYNYNYSLVPYLREPGVYTVHAYNNTHKSWGSYNATLTVTAVEVTCEIDGDAGTTNDYFIWGVDKNISATFTATYKGQPINNSGFTDRLRIDNVSKQGSGTTQYNKTWANSSFGWGFRAAGADASPAGSGRNTSIEVTKYSGGFVNGVVKINDITSNSLDETIHGAVVQPSERRITFKYKHGDSGSVYANCTGVVLVKIPDVAASPAALPYNEAAELMLTVTGRGVGLDDVRVNLTVPGMTAFSGAQTNNDGVVVFAFTPPATGDITIRIENRTSSVKVPVTLWSLYVDVPSQVNEGESFTVTIRNGSATGAGVAGATVTIRGIGTETTNANGEATFTAPSVTSDREYTIIATLEGHAEDSNIITIINVPVLSIVYPDEVEGCSTFEVIIADDAGNSIIGATITASDGKTYTSGVNGIAKIAALDKKGTMTLTASKTGFADSETVTITVKACPGIPGFELLSLIAALGVAFILFRRRRR